MLYHSSLLANLSRYRKRKRLSLDGTVVGLEYARRSGKPVYADIGPWGSAPKDYVPSPAQSYDPHPGFADFPEPEYETYYLGMPHHFTPMIRHSGLMHEREPAIPKYNNSLMTDELLAEALNEAIARPDVSEPIPLDQAVGGQERMNGDSLDDIVMDLAQNDPAQEIESAIDQQMQQMAEPFAQEPQPEPMQEDPFQEQQQMYDEQMRQLMDPFMMPGMMGPGPMM